MPGSHWHWHPPQAQHQSQQNPQTAQIHNPTQPAGHEGEGGVFVITLPEEAKLVPHTTVLAVAWALLRQHVGLEQTSVWQST